MKKLTLLLFVALTFSCSSDDDRPLRLTVGLDDDAYYEIYEITLAGNSFENISIPRGTSKTFTVSEIPGGVQNVVVNFKMVCGTLAETLSYWSFTRTMNFNTSKTVIIGKAGSPNPRK